MKKGLLILFNKVFKKDLELLYGIGSDVEITNIIFSTNNKIHVISCKLKIGDVKLYEDIGETGLNYLFEESWKYLGFYDKNFMLQISFDLTF
jgi:hypothetical protein